MSAAFAELFARAQSGDSAARALLYERYAPRVMGAVRRRLSGELRRQFETLDLAQSVFADVLRDLPRIEDRGEDAFLHWLYIKVENKVRQKLRKHLGRDKHRVMRQLGSEPRVLDRRATPVAASAAREEQERLRGLVQALDDVQQQVVLLRIENGLKFGEIASRLELASADAARKRYARSLVQLRELWDAD